GRHVRARELARAHALLRVGVSRSAAVLESARATRVDGPRGRDSLGAMGRQARIRRRQPRGAAGTGAGAGAREPLPRARSVERQRRDLSQRPLSRAVAGIDLVYTGAGGQLKSTFIVKPGADPGRIRLAYRGAAGVRLTDAGRLEVSTPVGSFADDRPFAYQDAGLERVEVPVAFALGAAVADGAQEYGFAVGQFDRTQTLVLDPSLLIYAGYIGGAGADEAGGIALDTPGNAYVVGTAQSAVPPFPAQVGPHVGYARGSPHLFPAQVNADGSHLVYLGYIGGADGDVGTGIAIDAAGNAYVTGFTLSDEASFPVKVGPGLHHSGGVDAFVAKVKADGGGLVYCGYIGGAANDEGWGIDVDAAGNAYVTGVTASDEASFPVKVGPRLTFGGGNDAFVAKVKADGTALVYAGYIGGADDDFATAIAVDTAGNAYVTGYTESDQTTFPVKVGPPLTFSGARDAFVAKVKTDGTAFVYAGYIGGTGTDQGTGIAVDATGNAYVSGFTSSDEASFPVKVGPALFYRGGAEDGFVAKVKRDGTALVYVGYIGGAASDAATGIAVDAAGNAYVVGGTASDASSFPVLAGPGLVYGGGLADAFVAKGKADGTRLLWAGYIGGDGFDQGNAIAVDAGGSVYVAGSTSSAATSFPVTVGPDLTYGGGQFDAFVAKISGKPDLIESKISDAAAAAPGGTL